MRPVNLLPKDGPADRRRRPPTALLAAGAAPLAAAALVYVGWSAQHATAQDRAGELAAVQTQVDALEPSAGDAAASRLASLRSSRTAAVSELLGKRVAWDGLLVAIARVLPADVWLTDLSLQSPVPIAGASTASSTASTAAPATQGLQLTGSARSQAAVAHALARIAVVPGLGDVTLGSTTSTLVGKKPVVQFQISATIGGGS